MLENLVLWCFRTYIRERAHIYTPDTEINVP